MGDVSNITIVKFKNPFVEQIDGKLRLNSNVSIFTSLFGSEVANTTTTQRGGICSANEQCNPPVFFRPINSFNYSNIQHTTDLSSIVATNDIPVKREYRLFSIFGQLLGVYSNLDQISHNESNWNQGLYILSTYEDGKIISSKKHFLSNNNY